MISRKIESKTFRSLHIGDICPPYLNDPSLPHSQ